VRRSRGCCISLASPSNLSTTVFGGTSIRYPSGVATSSSRQFSLPPADRGKKQQQREQVKKERKAPEEEEEEMSVKEAQPYPFTFPRKEDESTIALMMIDMQRDFLEEGGFGAALGNDVKRLASCIPAARSLLNTFRDLQLPVIHTKEAHKADLSDCPISKIKRGGQPRGLTVGSQGGMGRILIDGEPGNDFISDLQPKEGEVVIVKPGKGAFYATPLFEILHELKVSHLVFAGVTTEVCVQTTMREANDRGFECILIEDATESYFPQFKSWTVEMIKAQGGIVGWVASSDDLITALKDCYVGFNKK